jgi:hypothetical protein
MVGCVVVVGFVICQRLDLVVLVSLRWKERMIG